MTEKIKVLHIVGAMNKGGTETMLMNIYRNIDRDNIQFDFVSFSEEEAYYDKEIKLLGGKVISLNMPNIKNIKNSILDLCNIIEKYGPYDAIHAHTLFNSGIGITAAKKCGVKVRICHSHTTQDNNNGIKRKIYAKAMRYLINKNSTHLLACSDEAGRFLFGDKSLKKENYTCIPNLIDYKKILNTSNKKVKEFKSQMKLDNAIVLGHIGTFKESKNHIFILNIVKYMTECGDNIKLLLVGDGSLKARIEEITKEYDIENKVIFVGIRDDIDVMIGAMDVFIFPSIYEGFGLVLLEAQAGGIPCVVSKAIQPEVDLGIGLVNKLSLDDSLMTWRDTILQVLNKREDNQHIIEEAFNQNGYSIENCVNKFISTYNFM